jgi:hypothetical protein
MPAVSQVRTIEVFREHRRPTPHHCIYR